MLYNIYMFPLYVNIPVMFYDIFLKPKESCRRGFVLFMYLLFLAFMLVMGIVRDSFVGTYQRYGLAVVAYFIVVAITCKKSPFTRLVQVVFFEYLFGIILCLFIKIFITIKAKYPGLPIGTCFFFYEKMVSKCIFLILC